MGRPQFSASRKLVTALANIYSNSNQKKALGLGSYLCKCQMNTYDLANPYFIFIFIGKMTEIIYPYLTFILYIPGTTQVS